jgi:dihydropteroate synthase
MEKARSILTPAWPPRLAAHRARFLAALTGPPVLMGILNITPDSFSDGGLFERAPDALAHTQALVRDGASIVDIGGESTRPGHVPITADVEWARLLTVLPHLAVLDVPLSIDTTKSSVARKALAAGASVVNDIWGLQGDAAMARTVAEAQAGVIVMHNRREADAAIDIVADIQRFFERSLDIARRAGIPEAHVVLDPGIGFGKTQPQNLAALRATGRLAAFGRPLLVGVSRKSLFGMLLGVPTDERVFGSIAAGLYAVAHGARILRVHDVREHAMALKVIEALERG